MSRRLRAAALLLAAAALLPGAHAARAHSQGYDHDDIYYGDLGTSWVGVDEPGWGVSFARSGGEHAYLFARYAYVPGGADPYDTALALGLGLHLHRGPVELMTEGSWESASARRPALAHPDDEGRAWGVGLRYRTASGMTLSVWRRTLELGVGDRPYFAARGITGTYEDTREELEAAYGAGRATELFLRYSRTDGTGRFEGGLRHHIDGGMGRP